MKIIWEGPLFHTPIYHNLSAHAINCNNAFHKEQDQKTSAITALIKSNVCSQVPLI